MRRFVCCTAAIGVLGILLPVVCRADGLGDEVKSLHDVLEGIYNEMIPMCSDLINVGRGIAGFGALWYIASRVWRNLASAESIEFYPLLRPFAIGLALLFYPSVVGLFYSVLKPISDATGTMLDKSNTAVSELLKEKEEAIKKTKEWEMYVGESETGNREAWYKYTHLDDPDHTQEGVWSKFTNSVRFVAEKMSYNFRRQIKQWISEVLSVLYAAAALCINTMRTFNLIVLVVLGPLVLGFSVFDGFQHTLANWAGRYVNIFLWLPVCNLFGSILGRIQENMLKIDISQIKQYGDTFFTQTDTGYLVFMVIGVVGYTTIPNIASYIVQATGANAALQKITSMATTGASIVTGRAFDGASNIARAGYDIEQGYKSAAMPPAAPSSASWGPGAQQNSGQASKIAGGAD